MRFRYVFYGSVLAGFLVSFGVYVFLSGRDRSPTTVLGTQDIEIQDKNSARQKPPKTYSSNAGGYSITVPSQWTIDTTDPALVLIAPPGGAYTAIIDTVPDEILSSQRMERIVGLEDLAVSDVQAVPDDLTKVDDGRLYGDTTYYFSETISGKKGLEHRLSEVVKHGDKMYILSISYPNEQSIKRLRKIHDSVFSSFVFDDGPLACDEGFVPFQHGSVWLCYPRDLSFDSSELPERYVFSSDQERLLVEPSSDQTWPIHLCNLSADITVNGNDAQRTIFREDTGAGCGAIIGFATRIEGGDEKPWFVGLLTESGTYLDESEFSRIENSLHY